MLLLLFFFFSFLAFRISTDIVVASGEQKSRFNGVLIRENCPFNGKTVLVRRKEVGQETGAIFGFENDVHTRVREHIYVDADRNVHAHL